MIGFKLSEKLIEILQSVSDPISDLLLSIHNLNSDLCVDLSTINLFKVNNVTDIKIGKFVRKFTDCKSSEIEKFIIKINSITANIDSELFELINGVDIPKWYLVDNYCLNTNDESTLHKSCMRMLYCQSFFEFLIHNNDYVSLLIHYSDESKQKISGRALIWKVEVDNQIRYFMDRIYYNEFSDLYKFKTYANKNGYLSRVLQANKEIAIIYDPICKYELSKPMYIHGIKPSPNNQYPYMDTLYFYEPETNILTNDNNVDLKVFVQLSSESGQTSIMWSNYGQKYVNTCSKHIVRSELVNDYIQKKDCEFVDGDYIPNIIIENKYVFSNHLKTYLDKVYAVYSKRYCGFIPTTDYAVGNNKNFYKMIYSEFNKEFIFEKDSTYSQFLKSYLPNIETIKVYTDIRKTSFYYTSELLPMNDFYLFEYEFYKNTIKKTELI